MTLAEAAALLGVAKSTLQNQVRNGKLRARRDRHGWIVVTAAEVERYRRESLGKPGRRAG